MIVLEFVVVLICIIVFIGFLTSLKGNKVGKNVIIKALKSDSPITVFKDKKFNISSKIKKTRKDVWYSIMLDEEVSISGKNFDFILIKVKSVDDKLNKRKGVVCHLEAGHSSKPAELFFIDWAFVRLVE